jgi:biotin carboxyl carrier protein
MSIEIPSLTDPEVMASVPVQKRGGRVYMTTRADSRAAADEAAVGAGLMIQRTREDGSAYLVEPVTVSRVAVGPVVITPGAEAIYAPASGSVSLDGDAATLDSGSEFLDLLSKRSDQTWLVAEGDTVSEGDLLAAAITPIIDSRHHDNWLITPTQMHESGRPLWEVTVLSWVANGSPIPQANAAEQGVRYGTVELIDPETINSPSVVVS